jgi:hypothetical protein
LAHLRSLIKKRKARRFGFQQITVIHSCANPQYPTRRVSQNYHLPRKETKAFSGRRATQEFRRYKGMGRAQLSRLRYQNFTPDASQCHQIPTFESGSSRVGTWSCRKRASPGSGLLGKIQGKQGKASTVFTAVRSLPPSGLKSD